MPPKRPSSPGPVANGAGGGKVAATSTRDRAAMRDLADGAHDERGEFEDAWEDEFEEEDVQSDDEEQDDDDDDDDVEGVIRGGDTGMEDGVNGEGRPSVWTSLHHQGSEAGAYQKLTYLS